MSRLFDSNGSHKCWICHQHPNIGWVYRCTQDHGGDLPESDFIHGMRPNPVINSSEDPTLETLSPWITKGIENGQYSQEQIDILKAQRLGVKRAIASVEDKQAELFSKVQARKTSLKATKDLFPIESDPRASVSTFSEQKLVEYSDFGLQPSTKQQQKDALRKLVTTSACQMKTCHTCRPTFRDRTWTSLDAAAAGECTPPPEWELSNRRISDLHIVQKLGLHKKSHVFRTFDSLEYRYSQSSIDMAVDEISDETSSESTEDERRHRRRGRRLRNGLKDVIRERLRPSDVDSYSPRSSRESSRTRRLGRKLTHWTRRSRDIVDPAALGASKESTVSVLLDAVNTPLPEGADDTEDLEGGEVEVEDGVAVMEEGVGTSAADIILHA